MAEAFGGTEADAHSSEGAGAVDHGYCVELTEVDSAIGREGVNGWDEALVTRDQLLSSIDLAAHSREPQHSFIVCEPLVAQSLALLTPQLVAEPTAADALPLALARIQQRAIDDLAAIDANYLRRTDAEIFAKPIAAAVSTSQ